MLRSRPTTRRALSSDEGFTLAELMVYALISVVLLLMIGGIFAVIALSGVNVQQTVAASTSAQSASDSLTNGLRNATGTRIDAAADGGQLLKARVATSTNAAATYVCAAWYYSPVDKSIRYHQSTTGSGIATASSSWTLLTGGVVPISGTTIFGGTWSQVTIRYNVTAEDHTPSLINTFVASRYTTETAGGCY